MNFKQATLGQLRAIALESTGTERNCALLELDNRIERKESKKNDFNTMLHNALYSNNNRNS